MIKEIKQWWEIRTSSEKRTLFVASISLSILAFYLLIFAPLNTKVNDLRFHVSANTELLNWMQKSNQQIDQLTQCIAPKSRINAANLLTSVQSSLGNINVNKALVTIQTPEENMVLINFQQINFSQLIIWLDSLWQNYGIIISSAEISSTETPGIVHAEINLYIA